MQLFKTEMIFIPESGPGRHPEHAAIEVEDARAVGRTAILVRDLGGDQETAAREVHNARTPGSIGQGEARAHRGPGQQHLPGPRDIH